MTALIPGTGLRLNVLGAKMDRVAATLPATTNYFAMTVGRILLMALVGEVTTAIQAQANACKWTSTPTVGSAVDMCATVDLNAKELGTMLGITGLPSDAMVATNSVTTELKQQMILPIGNLKFSAAATNTGATKWALFYVPIDDGATVTAV